MKYADVYRKVMFSTPSPMEAGSSTKNIFARNCMKCSDVHSKAMFGSPHFLGMESVVK